MIKHVHTAYRSEDYCYSGPIASADEENPLAHGNIVIVEQCTCGAERRTNSNGGQYEEGAWTGGSTYES